MVLKKLKIKYLLYFIFVFICIGSTKIKHPFYFSFTDFEYNQNEKSLQGNVKLFINDLEVAIKNISNKKIDLIKVTDTLLVNKALHQFVNKNFSVSVNNVILKSNFIGFEKENDVMYLYIEYLNCPVPKSVSFVNTFLYNELEMQTNFISFKVNNEKKTIKLVKPDKFGQFDF
jgi:hypothetical protein